MKTLRILALITLLTIPSLLFAQKSADSSNSTLSLSELQTVTADSALPSAPSVPLATSNGTLLTQTAQSWTTAPWIITSGPGPYPDGGGVATWGTVVNTIVGTVAAGATVTIDTPITLSGITYNSPFSMTLAGTAANNLGLDAGGAIFNVALSIMNTPSLFQLANNISAPITGGGSAGLTKTGNGTMTLGLTTANASTYTGGTHINGGILVISATAAVGDSVLGATGAGNGISMDGGALFNNITAGWTTGRDISLGAGGGTIYTNTNATVNGVISGSGALNDAGFGSGVGLTLTNANTYTGATITSTSSVSLLTLSGNGSINTSSSYDLAGTLALSNAATNNNDRLNDTAAITSRGATMTLTGNSGAATTENAGALTLANGTSTITVTPNAAQQASLNFASITRQNNATLFVRGTGLGATPAANVAQVTSTASPGTLIGGGGAAGSTNISILPWAVGNTSASATAGSSFVTWDAATGRLRPLALAEYTTLSSGLSTTDNTRLTGATAIGAATTVNSVLVAGSGTLLSGTGGLNITSGALLYSPTTAAAGTISANVNFGSAEGVLTNGSTGTLAVSGVLSGSGGLTLASPGTGSITLSGANTYTGQTTLLGGTISFSGTVANDGVTAGAFGLSTSAIVMNVGTTALQLWANTAGTVINRNISVQGTGPGTADLGTTSTAFGLTVNGNIDLQRQLVLDTGSTAAASLTVNGNITGTGGLRDAGSFSTLNGTNSYSGGTDIQTGTWAAGSNTAFGSGTIYFSNTGKIQSADATAHTFTNDIFLGANPTFQGTGALTFGGGVNLNGARSFAITDTAAAGVTFTGVISNGALTKTGTGLMALNSATGNTYSGGTVLGTSAGTLNVNNTTGSGTGTGTVSIGGTTAGNRSTLSGNFTISGATSIGGVLSPGNSVGTANFGSTLSLTSNALVTMEIGSSVSADKINVAGLLALGGVGTTFNVLTIGGYQAVLGDTYDLVDWGSLSGTATINVSSAILADPVNTMWDTSNFLTNGTITVVPEPSTFGLMFCGAGLMLAAARRFRRR